MLSSPAQADSKLTDWFSRKTEADSQGKNLPHVEKVILGGGTLWLPDALDRWYAPFPSSFLSALFKKHNAKKMFLENVRKGSRAGEAGSWEGYLSADLILISNNMSPAQCVVVHEMPLQVHGQHCERSRELN